MMTTTSTIRRRRLDRSGDIYFSAQKYLSELSEMKTSLGNLNMLWHLLYLSSFLSSYLSSSPYLSFSLSLFLYLSLFLLNTFIQRYSFSISLAHSLILFIFIIILRTFIKTKIIFGLGLNIRIIQV